MIHFGGPNQKNEFGDLWNSRSKSLVHVKRMSDSATLSHLWAQGTVAIEMYRNDQSYRDKVHRLIPTLPPDLTNTTLVYAVATPKRGTLTDDLFFFSKVRALQSLGELRNMYCAVELVKVQMV